MLEIEVEVEVEIEVKKVQRTATFIDEPVHHAHPIWLRSLSRWKFPSRTEWNASLKTKA